MYLYTQKKFLIDCAHTPINQNNDKKNKIPDLIIQLYIVVLSGRLAVVSKYKKRFCVCCDFFVLTARHVLSN